MDDDRKELINRLFAEATAMLEDASVVAVAGQSRRSSTEALAALADRLLTNLGDVTAVIGAARALVAQAPAAPDEEESDRS